MAKYEVYEQLLITKGVTKKRVQEDTRIAQATFSAWKLGKYEPKRDKIQILADYFNVPISVFYDEDDHNQLTDEEQSLLAIYNNMNAQGQKSLREYAQYLIGRGEYKKMSSSCVDEEAI